MGQIVIKTPPKETLGKIIPWVLGALLVLISIFWVLAIRENRKLQNQILEINNRLISEEETKQTEILKATEQVDRRIRSLEQNYQKAKTDEDKTITNFQPLDTDAAARFITDYARRRRAEQAAAGDGSIGGRQPSDSGRANPGSSKGSEKPVIQPLQ